MFGAGSVRDLPAELDTLGVRRIMLITTPGRTRTVAALRAVLGERLSGVYAQAKPHIPESDVLQALAQGKPDAYVSLGGGSATGLGKALARETGLPLAAIPTTYAGSEMTAIWGISDGKEKRTGRDPRAAPRLVVYDAELTYDLPATVSAASGMNAIAHCVEALYAADASPVSSLLAEDGIVRLTSSLPVIMRSRADPIARGEALVGAHLAGRALDMTSMGLHHKLCHVLGGSFGLPHAETHAALLPYVVAYNAPAAPDAAARIATALGTGSASAGLQAFGRRLGTLTLAQLGLPHDAIPRVAKLAIKGGYPNPRPVTEPSIRALLEDALAAKAL